MPIQNRSQNRSIAAFNTAIRDAAQPRPHEHGQGKVTQAEARRALKKLPDGPDAVAAAQSIYDDSSITLTAAAEDALLGFIDQHQSASTSGPISGFNPLSIRLPGGGASAQGADAIRAKFDDVGFARKVTGEALADLGLGGINRSQSPHLVNVSDGPMGTFFADVDVTHFMNANDVQAELRIQLDGSGRFLGAADRPAPAVEPAPVQPAPSQSPVEAIRAKFDDVGFARGIAGEALRELGQGGMNRSQSPHLVNVSDGPMGTFFADVDVTHFMNPNDVQAELRIQLDRNGHFLGAADRPSSTVAPDPVAPAPSQSPVDAMRARFDDVAFARGIAGEALADLGMPGLSRSDTVLVGDVSEGPMGSFFVDAKIAEFMHADNVRADVRLQVSAGGDLLGVNENAGASADAVAVTGTRIPLSGMKAQMMDALVDVAGTSTPEKLAENVAELAVIDPFLGALADSIRSTGKVSYADLERVADAQLQIMQNFNPVF